MQFSGGSGYCISAVSLGTRCTNDGPPNSSVLVFEYKCASLVSRCHGSVTRIVIRFDQSYKCRTTDCLGRVFNVFLYCIPCFRVQCAGVMLCLFSVFYSCFESVTQFSYSAFYQASVTS